MCILNVERYLDDFLAAHLVHTLYHVTVVCESDRAEKARQVVRKGGKALRSDAHVTSSSVTGTYTGLPFARSILRVTAFTAILRYIVEEPG
jgi:hypothetical protein